MGFKDKSISIASYDALGRRIVSKGDTGVVTSLTSGARIQVYDRAGVEGKFELN